ncbi:3-hydroxyacyl-CoA dehydrogenase [Pontibacter sp. 172403-2]|uniref:3-hydroxyacyl-CoA dehydrogenase family protein n=1 Tax=Pontibacter rufus TaxID=2791028 RepID=UPI0018AF5452|nr:3-hydroxyacyl-CoA dehydrogenase family protein [Pontibacter sp. 172403-2]MBF9253147.1 3-hydroxyacyl-CoA dehydrogenase [Pontibacter sp. 172403-2]
MRILVLLGPEMAAEFRQKFPENQGSHTYTFLQPQHITIEQLTSADIVFDFLLHEKPARLSKYEPGQVVFCNAATVQLAALVKQAEVAQHGILFGFNGLPTLFNREVLEVSVLRSGDRDKLAEVCEALGTDYLLVDDRVGMVMPRMLCMIINEAFYTLQEQTASITDIDLGMKLGTNYPQGPFEWAEQIGITNVYKVLSAMYEDTRDERYKICPLLKTAYLKGSIA